MKKFIWALTILAFFIAMIYCAQIYSQNHYLPIDKWFSARVYGKQIGLDGYTCRKIKLSKEQALRAFHKIGLSKVKKPPKHELLSPIECKVEWWDVNFPYDAEYYLISENGSVRELATWRNGYFYLTYEIR